MLCHIKVQMTALHHIPARSITLGMPMPDGSASPW
jgi:hypothetical protein